MVYLIKTIGEPFCKIGYTANIEARFAELQTGNHLPLQLIATRNGGYELENTIHIALNAYSLRGEWFYWEDKITEEIFNRCTTTSIPNIFEVTKQPVWYNEAGEQCYTFGAIGKSLGLCVKNFQAFLCIKGLLFRDPKTSKLCVTSKYASNNYFTEASAQKGKYFLACTLLGKKFIENLYKNKNAK